MIKLPRKVGSSIDLSRRPWARFIDWSSTSTCSVACTHPDRQVDMPRGGETVDGSAWPVGDTVCQSEDGWRRLVKQMFGSEGLCESRRGGDRG